MFTETYRGGIFVKTFTKALCLTLSICVIISAFVAGAFSASANYGDDLRRADIKNAVSEGTDTNKYYFYMPEEWRNTYNDAYDGKSLSSCVAGIFWWSGTANCDEYYKTLGQKSWPGYVITEKEVGDENIFIARCPKDVENIIFNNAVDGGEDQYDEKYLKANQTVNIYCGSRYPEDDEFGFYPNGLDSMDNMIYVCNTNYEPTTSELTKETVKGEWFYYYGGGKYGYLKTLAEAQANNAVFSGGKFPELTGKSAENDTPKVTPVQPKVTVKAKNTMKVKAKNVTVKASKLKSKKYTFKAFTVTKAKGKVSYAKVSGSKALSVGKKGNITVKKGTKRGSYTIKVKITAKGSSKYLSKSVTKKVKVKVK